MVYKQCRVLSTIFMKGLLLKIDLKMITVICIYILIMNNVIYNLSLITG